jgi:hypothetical protein
MPPRATKIGGVDPAVIRELSGIYQPFVKAFKELISNSYDADADRVDIQLSEDFRSIEIFDDGRGLTPDEFRTDFTKIGGSYTRLREELTSKQRPKIGSKGIGFLAVARYCSRMDVESTTVRESRASIRCTVKRKKIDLASCVDSPIPRESLVPRITVLSITPVTEQRHRSLGRKYNRVKCDGVIELNDLPSAEWSEVDIEYSIKCNDLLLRATIDFDYLLSLENKKDLEEIEDFCTVEICELPEGNENREAHFTRITLHGLKDFVARDLRADRKSGYVRNVESYPGLARFIWHLRRCIPVKYELPEPIEQKFGVDNLRSPRLKYIERVNFSGSRYKLLELTRPVWSPETPELFSLDDDICTKVDINEGGLVAKGYILGHSEIIYPAELRGLAVRVRNVQIGSPSFLGFESVATGFEKAALSQITGEINVLEGLDAIDALNPGRESFYDENSHFKVLKRHVVGDKESAGGLLRKIIDRIWKRAQVSAAAADHVARASQRRKALLDVALAVTHFSDHVGGSLTRLFSQSANFSNGLATLPENSELGPVRAIQGFRVENRTGVKDQLIDFVNKKVYVDFNHDRWSWRVALLGVHYEVIPKNGGEQDPLCQIDTAGHKVYINWNHPLRQQMGDAAFIKSSLAWKLAFHASQDNIENMMDLALNILSFSE